MVSESIKKVVLSVRKEAEIALYVKKALRGKLVSKVKIFNTPLGEKIVVYCARPRLVMGPGNERARKLEKELKEKFGLENPQIQAVPVENPLLDAAIVAEIISMRLEKYGSRAVRRIVSRLMRQIMEAGARGVEVRVSGKIIGERSTSIRFYTGNMKKSGEANKVIISKAKDVAVLTQGVIGIQVRILREDTRLDDDIIIKSPEDIDETKLSEIDPELIGKLKQILGNY